jgi:tetratricopeptide repeat protein 21B
VSEAVKHFNLARRDGEWGSQSLAHMIEIYINPEGENLWDSAAGTSSATTSTEGLEVAEALLQELKDIVGDNQVQVCAVCALQVAAVSTVF